MELRPEEITKIIRSQIKNYEHKMEASETGVVILVGDGIAKASGLDKCMSGELVEFPDGSFGMAQNLEEDTVSITILGSDQGIKEGDTVKRTGRVVSVPVGAGLIGLKCAEGILSLAASIDVVDLAPRILPTTLPEEPAAIVQRQIERAGVRFHLSDSVARFEPNLAHLQSGGEVPFDVLVLEAEQPSAIRRNVAFSEAVYADSQRVEDLTCALAEDEAQAGLILQFCLLSLRLLWAMEQSGAKLQELVRLWSAEIEYSDENIEKIVKAIKSLHFPKEQI